jgi:hybrid cluster-associated redox disulfide protein
MDTQTIHIHRTVAEVLQQFPHAFTVFLKNRTQCVGCYMQQFCTLRDVAETYEIPLERLIEDLANVSNKES